MLIAENYIMYPDGKIYTKIKNRFMKFSLNAYGYYRVTLQIDGKPKQKLVHRLLAEAFIKNPKNKPQVNHKNGIKTDIRLSNLEWVTPSENMKHKYKTGLDCNKGERHSRVKLRAQDVIFIRKKEGLLTTKELSCKFNVTYRHIRHIQTRKTWGHIC